MENHEHVWVEDKSRKHGRPPRFFVKCATDGCGAKAQAVYYYGKDGTKYIHPFQTKIGEGLVGIFVDVRRDQRERLRESGNASLTVRAALDKYFE